MKSYILNQLKKSADHLRNLDMNSTQDIQGEDVLGIYRNTGGENIVITDLAVHSPSIGRIEYKEIDEVHSVGEVTSVREIELKLYGGKRVLLPVDGGTVRYRDAFQMVTFLRKARWKVRKDHGLS